jgi:hypothetical protein
VVKFQNQQPLQDLLQGYQQDSEGCIHDNLTSPVFMEPVEWMDELMPHLDETLLVIDHDGDPLCILRPATPIQ